MAATAHADPAGPVGVSFRNGRAGILVSIDEDGFVSIQGRAKRFAKIAGEMVSLAAVEEFVGRVWPNKLHAVVSVPDSVKGEQLVLVTDIQQTDRSQLLMAARQEGYAELNVPKKILVVKQVPVLGTGKTNYPGVMELVTKQQP